MLQTQNNYNTKARIKERSQKYIYILKDKFVDDAFCGKPRKNRKTKL